jgi:ribosomal protein S12 methylthiotransferase accessory factor
MDRLNLPLAQAVRPASRSISVAQGKGPTLDAARASAAMEALEGFHAECVPGPREVCDRAGLEAAMGAPFDWLPRAAGPPPARVAALPARDLIGGGEGLVPADAVETDYTRPAGDYACHASSNGLAAGGTADEAALSALTELIERDALADWTVRPASERDARRIAPASVTDPTARRWIDRARSLGIAVALWDARNDLGEPVILCRMRDDRPSSPSMAAPCFGAGCRPDPADAIRRALAEAAQARIVRVTGARDDAAPATWGADARAARIARALAPPDPPDDAGLDAAALPGAGPGTVADHLRRLTARIAAAGVPRLWSVDLTRPGFGVPVVRLVAPGLGAPVAHGRFVVGARPRRGARP